MIGSIKRSTVKLRELTLSVEVNLAMAWKTG